jgi:YVTN family beta-propeller protein
MLARRLASLPVLSLVLVGLALAPSSSSAQLVHFQRGDSDGNLRLEITDAINSLGFLFLGNPVTLPCRDAADADDNGRLEISDPILTLGFLFLGNPLSLAPPFLVCGSDPTPDGLECEMYNACPPVLRRASKSSTISISDNDRYVVAANPEDGTVSVFATVTNTRTARVPTGGEPSAVVIHPDGVTAFVANRADATVVKLTGIDGASPVVSAPIPVGSEPTGLALSPTGAHLFVAEFAEGRVSVIDTAMMAVVDTIEEPRNPRALAVTNDTDGEEDDELLIVPDFYGEPVAGGEVSDTGRTGRVRIFRLSDLSQVASVTLAPIDSGFVPDGSAKGTPTVMTCPNQLASVAVHEGKAYITSVSASPQPPIRFNANVHPVVYVVDLTTFMEDRSNVGTTNLAREVGDALPAGMTRFFLADLIDIAFFGNSGGVGYALARGADVLQRVTYNPINGVVIGSAANVQIDLGPAPAGSPAGCQTPNGVVTAHDAARAFVNCWVNRRLGVIDLSIQALSATVESAPAPATAPEISISRGRRFYFTGRGRWSREGWSSCGSCHPDGLSDNITWSFGAGPRQTTSMDGSFSHGSGAQKQRIFNWTGIFEEMHDFERNTRGVSGGLGAITTSPTMMCGTLTAEVQDPATPMLPGNLAQPIKELQDRPENCTLDWDDIDNFVKTIRPPLGLRSLDAAAVTRGARLFGEPDATNNSGGCVRCHGGPGWTLSRRFWTPSSMVNMTLDATPFVRPPLWPASWNIHTQQLDPQPAAADTTGATVPPVQVACVIRAIGTFGLPGDMAGTDALERRDNGTRAQGRGGYNIPSLYGLSLGAPYLHHGQAESLEELFDDPRWDEHLRAGNPNFLLSGDPVQQRRDLIQFLLSIDADTLEQAVPVGFEGCPLVFP